MTHKGLLDPEQPLGRYRDMLAALVVPSAPLTRLQRLISWLRGVR